MGGEKITAWEFKVVGGWSGKVVVGDKDLCKSVIKGMELGATALACPFQYGNTYSSKITWHETTIFLVDISRQW